MFQEAFKLSDIAGGGMKAAKIDGREIAVCNYDGKFYAIDNRCSHMNGSLETGTLDGYILTCPLHYAQFDITTGEVLSGPEKTFNLKTYPVQVERDSIKIDV
ncbi:MAG: non-heme iron oxygenase ferredoxin subunit [Candidatus Omnitrophica bacterium]|nr:non-heme iron oxygenase ferredoxin subunit [Candidatus Omnitrophota bacterium]